MNTRMGRPLKAAAEGDRVMLGLRVSADLKNKLDAAARKSGRSQSQEAEIRLQKSFDVEQMALMMVQRDENLIEYIHETIRKFAAEVGRFTPEQLDAAEHRARNQMELFKQTGNMYPNRDQDSAA